MQYNKRKETNAMTGLSPGKIHEVQDSFSKKLRTNYSSAVVKIPQHHLIQSIANRKETNAKIGLNLIPGKIHEEQ